MAKGKGNNRVLNEVKNFRASQDLQISALEGLTRSLADSKEITETFNDNLASLNKMIDSMLGARAQDKIEQAERERATKIENNSVKVSNAMKTLADRFISLAKVVADTANRYSQISNELIVVSGASGKAVRDTRTEIVHSVIKQINNETGNFLNPEKSYQRMVDIANQANIGNLEAIEAITRPMLIASETMNIKNDELAALFNKWYTRYNFSTVQMESMVDEIRGNTAGNNASAQATMENISKFQNFIGVYADSTQEMQAMVEAISQESSRLESAGINSGYIFDYMKQIGMGDFSNATPILSLLNASGTGIGWSEAQDLLRSGDAESMKLVSDALARGAQAIGDDVKYSRVTSEALKAYGLDVEEIYNILSASGILMDSDEFMKSVSGTQSAVEALDDKFNTHADKFRNIFNGISEYLANFQENFGVAVSDILQTMLLIYSAVQFRKAFGGGDNAITNGSIIGKGMSRVTQRTARYVGGQMKHASIIGQTLGASGGAATGLGLAAGAAGIGGGALMGYDGIKGALDDTQNTSSRIASGAEALGGIVGAAGLAVSLSNPVGWGALAIGAGAFLIKKATELKGNAEAVADNIVNIGDSLKKENELRVNQLDILTKSFYSTNDVEEQKNLLLKSGLFDQEELEGATADTMRKLLNSYRSAAEEMDSITDQITKTAKKYYSEEAKEASSQFFKDLKTDAKLSDEDMTTLYRMMLQDENVDEKTRDKINKMLEDGVTVDESRKIRRLLSNVALSDDTFTSAVNFVAANGNDNTDWSGRDYTTSKNYEYIMRTLAYLKAPTTSEEAFSKKVAEIKEKDLEEELADANGGVDIKAIAQSRGFTGYRTGSNYIKSDQYAQIHEGEAIVPKRYNPSANVTELEMLRKYYKDSSDRENDESLSSIREVVSALREIKEFLAYWKEDKDNKTNINNSTSRLLDSANYVSHYLSWR